MEVERFSDLNYDHTGVSIGDFKKGSEEPLLLEVEFTPSWFFGTSSK